MHSTTKYEELAIARLKERSYRITMPRILVIRALATSQIALDAYGLKKKIDAEGGQIDVVSVYRILSTLMEIGLAYQVGALGGKYFRREAVSASRYRILTVNVDTDFVVEMPAVFSSEGIEQMAVKHGFEFVGYQLEIEVRGK